MAPPDMPTIRIAVAILVDEAGRLLLVRKTGTEAFMQPGGKIEGDESASAALRRELREELGLEVAFATMRHLGRYTAAAAHEPGHLIDAEVFHVLSGHAHAHSPVPRGEIAEARWVNVADGVPLAPLTRDVIVPLLRSLAAAT